MIAILCKHYLYSIVDEYNTSKDHLFYLMLSDDPLTPEEKEEVS